MTGKSIFLAILLLSIAALPVFAKTYEFKNPSTTVQTLPQLISNILRLIFNVALVVVPLMAVIGGFMFVSAGGKPEQVMRARTLLLWTAIGFGIILFSRGLVVVLRKILGV